MTLSHLFCFFLLCFGVITQEQGGHSVWLPRGESDHVQPGPVCGRLRDHVHHPPLELPLHGQVLGDPRCGEIAHTQQRVAHTQQPGMHTHSSRVAHTHRSPVCTHTGAGLHTHSSGLHTHSSRVAHTQQPGCTHTGAGLHTHRSRVCFKCVPCLGVDPAGPHWGI